MGIKISELAKKLSLDVKQLRKKVQDLHLGVSEKANVFRDELADEIVRRLGDVDSKVETDGWDSSKGGKIIHNEDQKVELKNEVVVKDAVVNENLNIAAEVDEEAVAKVTETNNDLPEIKIRESVTVGELAVEMGINVSELMKELMKNGVMATINESIDYETAAIIGEDLGFRVSLKEKEEKDLVAKATEDISYDQKDLRNRPPIITVMGHVDHGKTSILDAIRETNVVSSESGGITQHMGAYQVVKNGKKITFIDTPGHKAFSAMRAHGAKLTDVAILVVAVDDGIKPQTIEAINHARAANVPIIVALNKIDKPGANVERTKKELADYNLIPESWGGKTIMVETSAKTGQGISELLDMILLLAEVEDLKAYKNGIAQGMVIEAHLSKKVGPVATVLITQGCLKVRDHIVVGLTDGVVRAMVDHVGDRITKAYPSDPVKFAGLSEVPEFGDKLVVVSSSKEAKAIVAERKKRMTSKGLRAKTIGMAELSRAVKEGKINELPVILKADVQGSLEAIKSSLENIKNEEVRVNILHYAAGAVSESDIMMAASSNALILAFRVKTEPNALKMAKKMGVNISSYDVIYRLLEDVTAALEGLLEPEEIDTKVGKGKVLKLFTKGKKFRIVGLEITKGFVEKGLRIVVYRGTEKVGEGLVDGLKRGNDNVDKVTEKHECGMGISGTLSIEAGDSVEFWKKEIKLRKLL